MIAKAGNIGSERPIHPSRLDVERSMDACTKCGICQAYCPVASVTGQFPGPKAVGPQSQRFRTIRVMEDSAADLCTGCGVCTNMCPNNVAVADMITFAKADQVERAGRIPMGQWMLNRPDLVGRISGLAPTLSNWLLSSGTLRRIVELASGIDRNAALPSVHGADFRNWLNRRSQPKGPDISYFSGCAVEHFDPGVGKASVALLNRLGYRVNSPASACCGLPMLSSGEWLPAKRKAERNIELLAASMQNSVAIVASSTSCGLALRSKYATYLNLTDAKSRSVANAVTDICEFLRDRHAQELVGAKIGSRRKCLYHGPCQLRNHQIGTPALELLWHIDGLEVDVSGAACCGIGGTYGYDAQRWLISQSIARTLLDQVRENRPDFIICDSETCRWHIAKITSLPCLHPVEVFLAALEGSDPIALV